MTPVLLIVAGSFGLLVSAAAFYILTSHKRKMADYAKRGEAVLGEVVKFEDKPKFDANGLQNGMENQAIVRFKTNGGKVIEMPLGIPNANRFLEIGYQAEFYYLPDAPLPLMIKQGGGARFSGCLTTVIAASAITGGAALAAGLLQMTV